MIVLTHIGNSIPEYVEACISQIRFFNSSIKIFFITNQNNHNKDYFKKYDVNLINAEDLETQKIKLFSYLLGHHHSQFWTNTATRILYIEEFLKHESQPILHFENDVLIYNDPQTILKISEEIFSGIGLTKGGPDRFMTGMMFVRNKNNLQHLTNHWINLLQQKHPEEIKKTYQLDMINEMGLFLVYNQDYGSNYLDTYPILPVGEHSKYYDKFNCLFDPATYGQYVGGTPHGDKPGFLSDTHIIGKFLLNSINWSFLFENKKPYIIYNNKKYLISNLHIHNKQLNLYKSY